MALRRDYGHRPLSFRSVLFEKSLLEEIFRIIKTDPKEENHANEAE
jgi:hypothetical protein